MHATRWLVPAGVIAVKRYGPAVREMARGSIPEAGTRAMERAAPAARRMAERVKRAATPPDGGWMVGPWTIVAKHAFEPEKDPSRRRTALAIGAGALLAYLFDPAMGRSRRAQIASRTGGMVRGVGRKAERAGRATAAEGYGLVQKAIHLREERKDYDDPTLQQKIKSEILGGGEDRAKIDISVDVADGVVTLRGTCTTSEAALIERRVRSTQGVVGVVNLLHEPGTPAPNKEASLRAT